MPPGSLHDLPRLLAPLAAPRPQTGSSKAAPEEREDKHPTEGWWLRLLVESLASKGPATPALPASRLPPLLHLK